MKPTTSMGPDKKGKKRPRETDTKRKTKKRRLSAKSPKVISEDDCFMCGDGGEVILCDKKDCPKVYHRACLPPMPDSTFKGRWYCPWHQCNICEKAAQKRCSECFESYCNKHMTDNIFMLPGQRFVCGDHEDIINSVGKDRVVTMDAKNPEHVRLTSPLAPARPSANPAQKQKKRGPKKKNKTKAPPDITTGPPRLTTSYANAAKRNNKITSPPKSAVASTSTGVTLSPETPLFMTSPISSDSDSECESEETPQQNGATSTVGYSARDSCSEEQQPEVYEDEVSEDEMKVKEEESDWSAATGHTTAVVLPVDVTTSPANVTSLSATSFESDQRTKGRAQGSDDQNEKSMRPASLTRVSHGGSNTVSSTTPATTTSQPQPAAMTSQGGDANDPTTIMNGGDSQPLLCRTHDEQYVAFCQQCKRLICVLCKFSLHDTHPSLMVIDAAREMRAEMRQRHLAAAITRCEARHRQLQQARDDQAAAKTACITQIDDLAKSTVQMIRAWKHDMYAAVNNAQQTDDVTSAVRQLYTRLQSLRELDRLTKEEIQDGKVAIGYLVLCEELDAAETLLKTPAVTPPLLKFTAGPLGALQDAIKQLGHVEHA